MFQGNPCIRGMGEQIEYSEEQLKEYIRCKEDILYFAEKYFYIISIDKGEIKIPLREYQKKISKALMNPPKRHSLISAPRQSSKCVTWDTMITIRNKKNGEIQEISIGELFDNIGSNSSNML